MSVDSEGNQFLRSNGTNVLVGAGWGTTPGGIAQAATNIADPVDTSDDNASYIFNTTNGASAYGCVVENGAATAWPLPGKPDTGADADELHMARVRLRVLDTGGRTEAAILAAHPGGPIIVLVGVYDGATVTLLFTFSLAIDVTDIVSSAYRTYETYLTRSQAKLIRDLGYSGLWWTVRWQQSTPADPFDALMPLRISSQEIVIWSSVLQSRQSIQVAAKSLYVDAGPSGLGGPEMLLSSSSFQTAAVVPSAADAPLLVSRQGVQIAVAGGTDMRVSRQSIQIGVDRFAVPGGGEVEMAVSRNAVQVAAVNSGAEVVVPIGFGAIVPTLFKHNFISTTLLITRWSTTFSEAVGSAPNPLAQERVGYLDRPLRTVFTTLTGLTEKAVAQIEGEMRARTISATLAPLVCDRTIVIESRVDAMVNVPDCLTGRYFIGAFVAIVPAIFDGKASSIQIENILSISDAGVLSLSGDVVSSVGDYVYPLVNADVTFKVSTSKITGGTTEATFEYTELPGKSAYLTTAPQAPVDFTYFDGVPVFVSKVNWRDGIGYEILATGDQVLSGQAQVTHLEGDRSRGRHRLPITCLSRAAAWEVIQFFDWCRGRLRKFWHVSVEQTLRFNSMVSASIVAFEKDQTIEWLQQNIGDVGIAFTYEDGSQELAKPTSIADAGVAFLVQLDRNVTTTGILRTEPAYLCHWEKDSITETWGPPDVMETELEAMEILSELDSPLTDDQTGNQ